MKKAGISVIISTYNWPSALMLSLKSLNEQTVLPDEVIVADDGSTEETKHAIELVRSSMKMNIIHCWQPDDGFRLAQIRNKALEKCNYPYIIQIDGDIICHPDFIKDHLRYRAKGYFITGRRINLNENDTKLSLQFQSLYCSPESLQNSKLPYRMRSNFLMALFRVNLLNRFINKGVLGCNMAYWLADAKEIKGYNELIVGWGKEDDEFSHRLMNAGVKKRMLKFGAIQYHLIHKLQSMSNLELNAKIAEDAKKLQITKVEQGLN